jgi:hypothetical protein
MKTKSIGIGFRLDSYLVWKACEFLKTNREVLACQPLIASLFDVCHLVSNLPSRFSAVGVESDKPTEAEVTRLAQLLTASLRSTRAILNHLIDYVDGMSLINFVLLRHRSIPARRLGHNTHLESDDAGDQEIADFINATYQPEAEATAAAVAKARKRLVEDEWQCFDACIWATVTAVRMSGLAGEVSNLNHSSFRTIQLGELGDLLPASGSKSMGWLSVFVKSQRPKYYSVLRNGLPTTLATSTLTRVLGKAEISGLVIQAGRKTGHYLNLDPEPEPSSPSFRFIDRFADPPLGELIGAEDCILLIPTRKIKRKHKPKEAAS